LGFVGVAVFRSDEKAWRCIEGEHMIHSAEEFVALRRSAHPVEYLRAANDSATEEVWMDVVTKYPDMKIWVVRNKTIPLGLLHLLARDEDPSVRFAVAMKRKCDHELFERLAFDTDSSVRCRVAWNAKTPLSILARMKGDSCDQVVEVVEKRLRGEWP
jgi:hypothetical protein